MARGRGVIDPYLGALVWTVLARDTDYTASEPQTEGEQGQNRRARRATCAAAVATARGAGDLGVFCPVDSAGGRRDITWGGASDTYAVRVTDRPVSALAADRSAPVVSAGLTEASWYTGCLRALPVIATDLVSAAGAA